VLGPILFSLYISDILTYLPCFHNIHLKLFADDVKVYSIYKAPSTVSVKNMQLTLNAISLYFDSLQLSIAAEKCEYVHLGPGVVPCLSINDMQLVEKLENRDLGLTLAKSLKNDRNINSRFCASLKQQYSLLKAVTVRDPIVLVRCYMTYVIPIVEFGCQIWSPHLIKDIKKIEKLQQIFTRTVFYRCFPNECEDHVVPSYKERLSRLKLLPLETRRVIADLILAFKIIKGLTTLSFSSFFKFRRSFGRRSRILYNFTQSKTRTVAFQKSFANRTARYFMILQNTDPDILNCDCPATFKNRLLNLNLSALFSLKF
jgi:hypothetical protein